MLSRFVVDLAKATHLIPVFRASLRQCVLLCLLTGAASAQYRFDHWTADNGLPQNIITAIHQTPEGYLWVATLDGLTGDTQGRVWVLSDNKLRDAEIFTHFQALKRLANFKRR